MPFVYRSKELHKPLYQNTTLYNVQLNNLYLSTLKNPRSTRILS